MTVVIVIFQRTFFKNKYWPLASSLFLLTGLSIFSAYALDSFHLQISGFESRHLNSGPIELEISLLTPDQAAFQMSARRIESSYLKDSLMLNLSCSKANIKQQLIQCDQGKLLIRHPLFSHEATKVEFSYLIGGGFTAFNVKDLHVANGKLSVQASKDNDWHYEIKTEQLDLAALIDSLTDNNVWLNHIPLDEGIVDIQARTIGTIRSLQEVTFQINASSINMDAEQVLEDVNLSVQGLLKKQQQDWHLSSNINLDNGAMYLVPGFTVFEEAPGFYLDAGAAAIKLAFELDYKTDTQQVVVDHLLYQHQDLIEVQGNGIFANDQATNVKRLGLSVSSPDIQNIYPVYIEPILLPTNFADLEMTGAIRIELLHEDNELKQLELILDDIFLEDMDNRFSIYGLTADINMDDSEKILISTLGWQSLSLYKLTFGMADMEFQSVQKKLCCLTLGKCFPTGWRPGH